jgi:long-chain acyl-CoA synthetase
MASDPILGAFENRARHHGSDLLLTSPQRQATVGEVSALADMMASRVAAAKLAEGSLVGLSAPNGPAFVAGYLGLRRALHPVLLLDWPTPQAELDRIQLALSAEVILVADKAWPESDQDFDLLRGAAECEPQALPAEVSTIRLSSGSTGLPQGIAHTSEALLADDRALRLTMDLHSERALASIPLSHAYGFSSLLLPALTAGWTLSIPEGHGPFAPITAATHGQVTFLPTVPAFVKALLNMTAPPPLPSSVRLVISAGAPLRPETAARFRQVYGQHIHTFYGASEVGGIAYDRVGSAAEQGALGPALEGVTIRLIPIEGEDADTGVVEVESPAAALGYYPNSDASLGNGRFRTSDLGRFDGENLVLLDRVDDMINVRGKKVSPREVQVVLEEMPGVSEAVIHRSPEADRSGDTIMALVASNIEHLSTAEVSTWCRQRLAAHKVPRRMRIVGEIPRSPRGKIDRQAVKMILEDQDNQP